MLCRELKAQPPVDRLGGAGWERIVFIVGLTGAVLPTIALPFLCAR